MNDLVAIRQEIESLKGLRAEFRAVALRKDDARRADLVSLRRSLSRSVARLGELTAGLMSDQDDGKELRQRYNAYRSSVALHQANWPAVTINDDARAYGDSANKVRDIEERYMSFLTRMLDR